SLRAEGTFTNILNKANLGTPNMNLSSGAFGSITSANDKADFSGARTEQISAHLQF
ncbi:MAG: hypothetical protein JF584_00005, partial [Acidobacteria bacterium]|nr:hypothetical protein [Acidobacteriota bacterium]